MPALVAQTDLRDTSTHPNFSNDGRPRTFGNGTASQKIDYIPPTLFNLVSGGGVFAAASGAAPTARCGRSTRR